MTKIFVKSVFKVKRLLFILKNGKIFFKISLECDLVAKLIIKWSSYDKCDLNIKVQKWWSRYEEYDLHMKLNTKV